MGKTGIYLNPRTLQVFRASTTHAAPDGPDWVLLSEDSMIGMVRVRDLAGKEGLVSTPELLEWTGRTDVAPPTGAEGHDR